MHVQLKINHVKQVVVLGAMLLASVCAYATDYQVGQVWKYKTRAGEDASRIYIAKIDQWSSGDKVFHLYINGLKIKSPLVVNGFQTELLHTPVTQAALDASVTELDTTPAAVPDISSGYTIWKKHFDDGQAGAYSVSVADIITNKEQAFTSIKLN